MNVRLQQLILSLGIAAAAAASAAAQLAEAMPPHDGGPSRPAAAKTVASWPPGTFLESVAVDVDGSVLVANHNEGLLERIWPSGERRTMARLPGSITGILRLDDGSVLATGRQPAGPETVYRIQQDGRVAPYAVFRDARFLNGLALLNTNTVLVADSTGGTLWRLDLRSGSSSVWLRHELLAHRDPAAAFPASTGFPAANGVKRHKDAVYVSNSDRAAILRIALNDQGDPGAPTMWAERLVADDFCFDEAGNLYAPTHPFNTIVRLTPRGERTTLASGAQGVVGPTAVTLASNGASLYVVGNSLIPFEGQAGPARLVRLDLVNAAETSTPPRIASPSLYMVVARTLDGSDAARGQHGPAYLRFLEQHFDRILFGGQVLDGRGVVVQRIYLVQAPSAPEALAFMGKSPYSQAGVYGDLQVHPVQGMLGQWLGGVAWAATPQ